METNESVATRISLKKLRTEYLENPLGIDERRPRLSWQIDAHLSGCNGLLRVGVTSVQPDAISWKMA
ncbi:MAG: hypothetical protein M1546_04960 [Chloroflexi bacterium]|nr:hypothetical protein [Chloroflexota bacterium]